MEEEQLQAYNSDSGAEDGAGNVDIDALSDELNGGPQLGWIQWFCSLEGHEFLVEIDIDYIKDHQFNLYGLQATFPKDKFKTCVKMILSPLAPNEEDLADEHFLELNQEASDLYGLVHARYIHTPRGLAKVYQKYLSGAYGYCPRALCDKQKVLPVGLADALKTSRFKVFCPRCEEVYLPKFRNINIDGAYFGTSFPHVFLKHYTQAVILPPKIYLYEPKIFGFKISGKRGSKAFKPAEGTIKYVEESMQGVEREKLYREIREKNAANKENTAIQ